MLKDEYTLINNDLDTNYHFIKSIKNTETTIINVLENNMSGHRVLVKYFEGKAEVYQKLKNIKHPNIATVYHVAQRDNDCLIVQEYIDGISLGEILEIERISKKNVMKIVTEICNALCILHNLGIVHRDIKPENIIIDNFGRVKLIDFNISRIDSKSGGKDTEILGTTGFAAPEQYGISNTDARSDIYSIGILINVLLTGEHPSKRICRGKWQHIVNKCTKINPDERYQNVKELLRNVKSIKYIVFSGIAITIAVIVVSFVVHFHRLDNTVESPKYMHTPTVDYDEINFRHRVFWGFMQEENGELKPYTADVNIKITNKNGDIVYNNLFEVDESDYSMWSNKAWDYDKLLGCVYIDDNEIEKGTSREGILSFTVKFDDGTEFEEYKLNIYDLPVYDFSIKLPELPYTIENYNSEHKLESKIEVLEVTPTYSQGTLLLQFKVKMLYNSDVNSSGYAYVGYKIKDDDGVVVSSNHAIIGPLEEGEILIDKEYCRGEFTIGENYSLWLIDVE